MRVQERDCLVELAAVAVGADAALDHRRGRLAGAAQLDQPELRIPLPCHCIQLVRVALARPVQVRGIADRLHAGGERVPERQVVEWRVVAARAGPNGGSGLRECQQQDQRENTKSNVAHPPYLQWFRSLMGRPHDRPSTAALHRHVIQDAAARRLIWRGRYLRDGSSPASGVGVELREKRARARLADKARPLREGPGLHAIDDPELAEDVGHVDAGCLATDVEGRGDLAVRPAGADQRKDLHLAGREVAALDERRGPIRSPLLVLGRVGRARSVPERRRVRGARVEPAALPPRQVAERRGSRP